MKAILLAAGNSRRFGKNKLLESFNGKLLYEYTLEIARNLTLDEIILVTQYEEIVKREKDKGISLVYNPNPQRGISESIKLGVKKAGEKADLIFLSVISLI